MLMGHAEGVPKLGSTSKLLHSDPESEPDDEEEADTPEQILYMASFDELGAESVQYDTIIWLSISLLLVLAWGIGIIMLLYLPIRRYVLKKEISSRKLYVTPDEIVYKVSRPSFIPFWGHIKFEKHVPLPLVIDIIIEQGCLQSMFGLHTFRVESIARGKAAPVDELQVQGVHNPGVLRKVIVTEASKVIHAGRSWRSVVQGGDGESISRMESLTQAPAVLRSPSKTLKLTGSPRHASMEPRSFVSSDFLLHKLEEVNKSVKKIEFLIEKSPATPGSS
ncbi:PREDICTED: uncharacterized protein LOC109216838 [Nicotiana attenuata]|uniref:DUF7642 domain-containing protein n=1 Tax=Nicotiana attenuata TaxID=49451 RepID=A0A1J6K2Z9_NICAT|nr:PREDICTED: uncharacterized protein LOC109216838 [Nicotiana attenuata]OIT23012.1 hypothetical protein A4A49_36884 [Nicotiana attenuata]